MYSLQCVSRPESAKDVAPVRLGALPPPRLLLRRHRLFGAPGVGLSVAVVQAHHLRPGLGLPQRQGTLSALPTGGGDQVRCKCKHCGASN